MGFLAEKEFWAKQARDFGVPVIVLACFMGGGWALAKQALVVVDRFVSRAIAQMDSQQDQYRELEKLASSNSEMLRSNSLGIQRNSEITLANSELLKANMETTAKILQSYEQTLVLQQQANDTLKRIEELKRVQVQRGDE